jgi:pimeloyl-ACP methyl ester carboxylesterase
MTLSSTQVTVRGVRSRVLQVGPEDSEEAVVFVHGNPGPGDDWTDLLGRVGEFARGVAPDMPGYGEADKPRSFAYTIAGYAEHLGGVLDELGIRRAHLVLHDFGGPWGLSWAVKNPDSFASATLINTGVLIDYKWHHYAKMWRAPVLGELFMATMTRWQFRLALRRENRRLPREAIDRIYAATRPLGTRRAVLNLYRVTPADMLAGGNSELRELDRPALVIWGTDDAYLPYYQAERQRQSFPSARIELLEGHGHWVFHEDPERVASLVIPFLREQVGASTQISGGSGSGGNGQESGEGEGG